MAAINWGMLAKSQIDNETIEQAIARLILAHNENEEAHLGAGQSLQSHKASEIIDHIVASIVADKIALGVVSGDKIDSKQLVFNPTFESIDAWDQTKEGTGANIFLELGSLVLRCGDTYYNKTILFAGSWFSFFSGWTSKNPLFRVIATKGYPTDGNFFVGMYTVNPWDDTAHVGFLWACSDAKLYAVTKAPGFAHEQVEITGVDVGYKHDYKFIVSSGGAVIDFYVDGALRTTVSRAGFKVESGVGPCLAVQRIGAFNPIELFVGSLFIFQDR